MKASFLMALRVEMRLCVCLLQQSFSSEEPISFSPRGLQIMTAPQSCASFIAPLADTLHNITCYSVSNQHSAWSSQWWLLSWYQCNLLYNTVAFLICYLVILRWLWPSLAYRFQYIRTTVHIYTRLLLYMTVRGQLSHSSQQIQCCNCHFHKCKQLSLSQGW